MPSDQGFQSIRAVQVAPLGLQDMDGLLAGQDLAVQLGQLFLAALHLVLDQEEGDTQAGRDQEPQDG